jgi:hypothetical protein
VVTLLTARFNIKKFYVVPTLRLCVLYGSQNKQQLLPYKTLIWVCFEFLTVVTIGYQRFGGTVCARVGVEGQFLRP